MADDRIDKTKITRDKAQVPCKQLPPGISASLQIVAGPEQGRVVKLDAPLNTLGRHANNTVVLQDASSSSRHAMIYFVKSM